MNVDQTNSDIYFFIYYYQASKDEITSAFRRLSRIYHPDKHLDPVKKKQATVLFGKVKTAYEGIYHLVIGDRLNITFDHWLESVHAIDAILPIIIDSHIFTELSTLLVLLYAPEGNSGASGFYPVSVFVRV